MQRPGISTSRYRVIAAWAALITGVLGCDINAPPPTPDDAWPGQEAFGTHPQSVVTTRTSGDAYIEYNDAATAPCTGKKWAMGTGRVRKVVTFCGGQLLAREFTNQWRNLLQGTTGVEFQLTAQGTVYSGASAWTFVSQSSAVQANTSIKQEIKIQNALLEVTMSYLVWPSSGLIQQWVSYKNRTASGFTVSDPEILDTTLFMSDIAAGHVKFHYFNGNWDDPNSNRGPETINLTPGWSTSLWSTHFAAQEYTPEVMFRNTSTGDGVLIGWSSAASWYAAFNGQGHIQVDSVGTNGWTLPPGETWEMPVAHMMVFQGDVDDGGNDYKEFQYRHKWNYTHDAWVGAIKPFIWDKGEDSVNSYSAANLLNAINQFRHVGATMIHIDAHWYDKEGSWNNKAGNANWAEVNAYAQKNGLTLMMWLPPWSAESGSTIANTQPGWLKQAPLGGMQLDNTLPGAYSWMKTLLDNKTSELGSSWIWRQDACQGAWTLPGQNKQHSQVKYFQLMKDFRASQPASGINVNNCGGNQLTLESMALADIVQTTDGKAGHFSVWTPSYLYPPDKYWGANLDPQPTPSGPHPLNMNWGATQTQLRSALVSAWEWNGDVANGLPSAAQIEAFRVNADIYKFMKSIGLVGRWAKIYHPDWVQNDDRSYYLQRMSSDNTRGVIIPMHSHYNANYVRVHPKGLIPSMTYTVRFHNSGHALSNTGSYWMSNGIGMYDWGGDLVWLNVQNHPGAGTDTQNPTNVQGAAKAAATYLGQAGVEVTWTANGTDNNWVSYTEVTRWVNGSQVGGPALVAPRARFIFFPGASTTNTFKIRTVDGDGRASGTLTL
jgi:hypothetical protein